jgi:hypothetical protein
MYNGATAPDMFGNFRLLRLILLRERITLVHAHQAFSVMVGWCMFETRVASAWFAEVVRFYTEQASTARLRICLLREGRLCRRNMVG